MDHLNDNGFLDLGLGGYLGSRKSYNFLLPRTYHGEVKIRRHYNSYHGSKIHHIIRGCFTCYLKVNYDNEVAASFSNNDKNTIYHEPMELKYFLVNERIENHHMCIKLIGTKDMVTFRHTKALKSGLFFKLVIEMGLYSLM